jgi:hypothetical protein
VLCAVSAVCNFGLGIRVLQPKHLVNSDKWKESNVGYRETRVLMAFIYFPNTVFGSIIRLHPSCMGQLRSLPSMTVDF